MCQQIDKVRRGKWSQQPVHWTMAGKWSNAVSPGEWIMNAEVSRESYLWVISPLLYPEEPAGAMELGDGGAQEWWRSESGTQERRDCRQAVRGTGESPWNVWDQTVTVREECIDIVLLVTGYMWRWSVISWVGSGVCSWWWLWLPDTVYIHKTLLNQIISISPATSLRYWLMSFRQFEFH